MVITGHSLHKRKTANGFNFQPMSSSSDSEMAYIVSGGALNSITHSLKLN